MADEDPKHEDLQAEPQPDQLAEENALDKEDAVQDVFDEREAAGQEGSQKPAEDAASGEASGSSRGNFSVQTSVEEVEKEQEESADLAFEKKPLPLPEKISLVEAALFQANKALSPAELAIVANCPVRKARDLVLVLQKEYAGRETAIQVEFLNDQVRLSVKPEFLPHVAKMSKEVEVSRKGMKILALIAKKGKMLQSELPRYFKGEIYDYVTDLKDLGYITSEKSGRSRVLKPTKRFHEHFQTVPT